MNKDSCLNYIQKNIELLKEQDADFVMLQEVDSPSTRSYNIDQVGLFENAFIVSSNVTATATNIDNGYLYSDHNSVKLTFTLQK